MYAYDDMIRIILGEDPYSMIKSARNEDGWHIHCESLIDTFLRKQHLTVNPKCLNALEERAERAKLTDV